MKIVKSILLLLLLLLAWTGFMNFGRKGSGDLVIGHDGVSRSAINNASRINLKSEVGIIIFETGSCSFAPEIANEWVYWKTGIINSSVMKSNLIWLISLLVIGYLIILSTFFYVMMSKSKKGQ
jgi:hypothetical protein